MSFSQTDSGVSYTIEGREAIDIYDQLGSAVGVYTNKEDDRVLVKMHYEYFDQLSMRIRTQVVCNKSEKRCTVSGYHLVLIDYPSH